MKFIPNTFLSDIVEFTLFDLLKIACGRELKCGALIARLARGNNALNRIRAERIAALEAEAASLRDQNTELDRKLAEMETQHTKKYVKEKTNAD